MIYTAASVEERHVKVGSTQISPVRIAKIFETDFYSNTSNNLVYIHLPYGIISWESHRVVYSVPYTTLSIFQVSSPVKLILEGVP